MVVARLAQASPVAWVVVVQPTRDQLTLVHRVVVGHRAGCQALGSVVVGGGAGLVYAHTQRVASQYRSTEAGLMCPAIATLLACAPAPIGLALTGGAAALGYQLGAAGGRAGLEGSGHQNTSTRARVGFEPTPPAPARAMLPIASTANARAAARVLGGDSNPAPRRLKARPRCLFRHEDNVQSTGSRRAGHRT